MESLKEMDAFLDSSKPSKLNLEVNSLNRPNEEIESAIKPFQLRKRKSPGPAGLIAEFY